MNPRPLKNILIINLKYLGDLIVTTPAIKAIREKYSEAKITVLVRKPYKDILAGNNDIDEIIYYDLSNKEKRGFAKIKSEIDFVIQLRSKKYDAVISLQAGDRYALWAFLCGAKFRVGPIENNMAFLFTHRAQVYENKSSFMDYYLELAASFGAEPKSKQTFYVLNQAFLKTVEDFFSHKNISPNDRYVCIHPGAGEASRKWNLNNYPLLINKILDQTEYKIVFTIGPQEYINQPYFESLSNSRVIVQYSNNVQELAWVISKSEILIGMDSGARHLAAALKIPSLALFPKDMVATWWFYEESDKQFYIAGNRNRTDKENEFLDGINADEVFEKAMDIIKIK